MILGIDPGLTGALALFNPDTGALEVHDVPTHKLMRGGKAKGEVDVYALANLLDLLASDVKVAWIEQVHSLPGQGVSSVFSFGKTTGILIGTVAAHFVRIEQVPPAVWKRVLKVPAAKDGARARASQVFPRFAHLWARAKDDGRAEASLIAYYGSTQGVT